MTDIPVVVVDDNVSDRYIVRRRLAKAGGFGEIFEVTNGTEFLERLTRGDFRRDAQGTPFLILMDVNMPLLTGFETILEMERKAQAANSPPGLVVMMLTSSSNPQDMAKAAEIGSIKGYVFKPLDDEGVQKIRSLYA